MATSKYFNHIERKSEQDMFEDLTVEQIQIWGYDIWYVPRTVLELDDILGDPIQSIFQKAFKIEALIPDAGDFGGDQAIMSKFGWRLNQTTNFMIARRRWREMGLPFPRNAQPQPGDVIFLGNEDFPDGSFANTFWEINQVWYDSPGFELGRQYCFRLACETFTYSHEKFRTGVTVVDSIDKPLNPYTPNDQDDTAINQPVKRDKQNLLKFDTGNPFGDF